jgi:hypothetical protein
MKYKTFVVKDQNGRIFQVKISPPSRLCRLFGIVGHSTYFSKNIWISSEAIDDEVDFILRHEIAHHYVPLRKKFLSRLMPASTILAPLYVLTFVLGFSIVWQILIVVAIWLSLLLRYWLLRDWFFSKHEAEVDRIAEEIKYETLIFGGEINNHGVAVC